MFRAAILVSGLMVCLTAFSDVSANDKTDWQADLEVAKNAINAHDNSYAIYKLRKSWLALGDTDLESDSHKQIKDALVTALETADSPALKKEASTLKRESFKMATLDRLFKKREANSTGEDYSVECKSDGTLEFNLNLLNQPFSPSNNGANVSTEDEKQWFEQKKAQYKAKLPLSFSPNSAKYTELLSLCQPLKPGEKKEKTGFDLSPFVPMDLPRTPDL